MSNFLAEAMEQLLSDEKSNIRIGAFERTGAYLN
jgi:hypothetical protein